MAKQATETFDPFTLAGKRGVAHFDPLALIDKRGIAMLCGVNPWTVDRWRKNPSTGFPAPIWLSDTTARWSRAAIAAWLQSRPSGGLSPNNPWLRRSEAAR